MQQTAIDQASEAIVELLAGPLDECRMALNDGQLSRASFALTQACDQLRRIRRDLRETAEEGTKNPAG